MVYCFASMGLRFFKRRNNSLSYPQSAGNLMLQWGCAFSSAEIKLKEAQATRDDLLQWGCAFSSAEIEAPRLPMYIRGYASMGLRFFKRRNAKVMRYVFQPT